MSTAPHPSAASLTPAAPQPRPAATVRDLAARAWPASGPVLLAVLLAARTLVAEGLEPAIGLSIAAVLVATAVAAWARVAAAPLLLLVGPIAFVASPARTELAFNLARPGDSGWYAFTLAIAAGVGLSLAGAVALIPGRPRWTPAPVAVLAVGFAALLGAIDPQPDLGRDLTAPEVDRLPVVVLETHGYGAGLLDMTGDRLQVRLENPSELPHTFTVDALDLDVYVPPGRQAVVDVALPASLDTLDLYCSIGDHRELGMVSDLVVRQP